MVSVRINRRSKHYSPFVDWLAMGKDESSLRMEKYIADIGRRIFPYYQSLFFSQNTHVGSGLCLSHRVITCGYPPFSGAHLVFISCLSLKYVDIYITAFDRQLRCWAVRHLILLIILHPRSHTLRSAVSVT